MLGGGQLGSVLEPFRLQIFQQAFLAAFASVSTLTVAAEAAGSIEEVRAVHPDHAGFELRSHVQCDVDVLAPDARCQAIDRIIGQFDRFSRSAECHRGEHGSEDLLLRNDRRRMHIAQQRRWIIKSARRQSDLRLPAGCAFGDALIDHPADAFQLDPRNDRADVDRFVERRADAQGAHAFPNLGDQSLSDAFLHQQARAGAAHLPLIEPDSIDQSFDCAVEVSVVENDERRFPPSSSDRRLWLEAWRCESRVRLRSNP